MAKNKLTPKQQSLVDTLVATGCSIKKATKAVGYSRSGGGETGRISGSKAMRLPHVRIYMREQMHEAFEIGPCRKQSFRW
jgi:phage terminase small subunit